LDSETSISALRKEVVRFRDEREWLKFNNPKDLSIALAIEAAELQELFLWKEKQTANAVRGNSKQFLHVKEEMADISIYLLSLSDVLDVDLDTSIREKLRKNALKYPVAKSKGNAKKYTELR
jgi:NTP pyrophosphatase (non-canonical NTP hydrolase)